jgi:integrase
MSVYKGTYKTKDGRCWKFSGKYKGIDGKIYSYKGANYHTKKDAEKAEQLRLKQIKEMTTEKNINDFTMQELAEDFIKYQKTHENVREGSFENYGYKIKSFINIANVKVTDFNDNIKYFEKWKEWVNARRTNANKPLKASAKNEYLKFLKSVIHYGNDIKDIDFKKILGKMVKFKDPNAIRQEKQIWTPQEFNQFIAVVNSYEDTPFNVLYKVLFYCGLRIGEAKALNWNDIDFEKGTIRIEKSINDNNIIGPPKNDYSYRTIQVKKELVQDLKDLLNWSEWEVINHSPNNYIFGGVVPITRDKLTRHLKKHCKLANVKIITNHEFRHSCSSMLISMGVNPKTVSEFLGHADTTQTLDTYTHSSKNDIDYLVNTLNKL